MRIWTRDGKLYHLIKPSAYGNRPTLAYEDGKLSFFARGYESVVTINMDDITFVA